MFKLIIQNRCSSLGTYCEIVLRWMPQNHTSGNSTLVQVMAWCHQARSHYLSQCWPRFMSPYGVNRPEWHNSLAPNYSVKYGTNPSPEPVLTYHLNNSMALCKRDLTLSQQSYISFALSRQSVVSCGIHTFTWGKIQWKRSRYQSLQCVKKLHIVSHISQGSMSLLYCIDMRIWRVYKALEFFTLACIWMYIREIFLTWHNCCTWLFLDTDVFAQI